MGQFFHEGGFGMFPTALFGVVSLGLALAFAVKPNVRLFPLVLGTGAASLFAGGLGMLMGLKATAMAIATHDSPAGPAVIAMAGASESANNLVLALALLVCVALALGIGGFRARRPAVA
jgi:hypothetical protein